MKIQPNFKRLGLKTGALHVELYDGDIRTRVGDISRMGGMFSSSVQIGNSDVVNEYAYDTNEQLIDTISKIKHMEGVDKVRWSEEVYHVPIASEDILNSFKNMWGNADSINRKRNYFNHKNNNSKVNNNNNNNKKYFY